jgi:hypothetical protein
VKDFEVRPIDHKTAKAFIVANHYSKNCPTGLNIFFGAFVDGELYAVADYGMGSNMDKGAALARRTGLPVRFQNITQEWLDTPHKNMDVKGLTVGSYNCLELKRLCRQGEKGTDTQHRRANAASKIPLTRFLALCHRALRGKGIEFIISYSEATWHPEKIDGKWKAVVTEATSGGIYRAANFQHLDQTAPEAHTVRESDGKWFHRRVAYKDMKRRNKGKPKEQWVSLAAVRQELGRVPILTPPKERWFLVL